MLLKLMVLDKNVTTQESNKNDSYNVIQKKLEEEYKELSEAIVEDDDIHIAEEVFDLIQVCIRVLVVLAKKGFNLEQLCNKHNKKLVKRGWIHSNIVRIWFKRN